MIFGIDGTNPLFGQMGVNLRTRQIHMTQQFLDHPEVGAVFQQMGGKGMPQGMGAHFPVESQTLQVFIEHPLNASAAKAGSPVI